MNSTPTICWMWALPIKAFSRSLLHRQQAWHIRDSIAARASRRYFHA